MTATWSGVLSSPGEAHECGRLLGSILQAGDLVVLNGPLGAGKTTLTQGLAVGLGVRGPITSPTFVIARVHPSLRDGPILVHVDAYRLGSHTELDDLDLDTDLEHAVTVVEWGAGVAEGLGDSRLEIVLGMTLEPGGGHSDPTLGPPSARTIGVTAVGPAWSRSCRADAVGDRLAGFGGEGR
ncbi:MAG: tRNA (adenosine(37)-N6)-threonylcarbamoyltransferase complex ATPase subunit type 1 TsaE [Ornithinimicrobium sp.]